MYKYFTMTHLFSFSMVVYSLLLLGILGGVLAESTVPPTLPVLKNVSYSSLCGNTSVTPLGNFTQGLDFDLFTPSSDPISAGSKACQINLDFDDWPVGYTLAITHTILRGHLNLPKGTRLFRFRTSGFSTDPVCCDLSSQYHFPDYSYS